MIKKKLYLHIGTHKTGSTALQVYLTHNRSTLRKSGVLYPDIGTPEFSRFGQHLIAWSYFENQDYLPFFKGNRLHREELKGLKLAEQIRSVSSDTSIHTIILSSEEFSILNPIEVKALANELEDFDVWVIIYFRRQDKYLEASYGTSVLYGNYKKNFNQFSNNQRMKLDYYNVTKSWESQFPQQVIVKSYESPSVKSDIVSDFLGIIRVDKENLNNIPNSILNKSISAHAIEVIRGLRLRGWRESDLDLLKGKFEKLYNSYHKDQLGSFMSRDQYDRIRDLYAAGNKRLMEEYSCDLSFEPQIHGLSTVKDFNLSLLKVFSEMVLNEEAQTSA